MKLFAICCVASVVPMLQAAPHKLLVISVDGMDARYLSEPDRIGVKIPNLRKLRAEGMAASGVVGVVPTVTWPSHTTMMTGVTPDVHGIPTNDQPGTKERWWYTSFLKARTLWQEALAQKRKVGTVYWPVTLGAEVNFNFPEFWESRLGHELFFDAIAKRATKGLEERVTRVYPSFPKSRFDDLTA
ncbi:MAG: alkaline phosphatase family protein, partial [Bryobacteraceae bacterium]